MTAGLSGYHKTGGAKNSEEKAYRLSPFVALGFCPEIIRALAKLTCSELTLLLAEISSRQAEGK